MSNHGFRCVALPSLNMTLSSRVRLDFILDKTVETNELRRVRKPEDWNQSTSSFVDAQTQNNCTSQEVVIRWVRLNSYRIRELGKTARLPIMERQQLRRDIHGPAVDKVVPPRAMALLKHSTRNQAIASASIAYHVVFHTFSNYFEVCHDKYGDHRNHTSHQESDKKVTNSFVIRPQRVGPQQKHS